jgi:hypothetical protein
MTVKIEFAPVSSQVVRKGWNSETTQYTFSNEDDALLFFLSSWVCGPIGEWKDIKNNVVTIFNCSAD